VRGTNPNILVTQANFKDLFPITLYLKWKKYCYKNILLVIHLPWIIRMLFSRWCTCLPTTFKSYYLQGT